MCTSAELWRCQEHVRHMRRPKRSYAQPSSSSALIASKSSSGSAGALAKMHLLQRVRAEAAAERLDRDRLLGRDVPEVDIRPELLDEPHLRRLGRRLEDEVAQAGRLGDDRDDVGADRAVAREESRAPTLARLGDHLPRTGS